MKSFLFETSILFSIIAIAFLVQNVKPVSSSQHKKNQTFPAVVVFGDSIVDPGNNNYIKTIIKCNFPPYGRNFHGGNPSGRFCNGKIPSDFIAESFGIKELIPPYLDPNLSIEDLVTGVSFASGGTGYDPLTAQSANVLSMSDQLKLFKEYMAKIKAGAGEKKVVEILNDALFIVCVGSDDIANTYFTTPFRAPHYDLNSYTDLTSNAASSFLQELHGLGAKKIGVFSAPPIGCVPSQRTLQGGVIRGCSDKENTFATVFNSKLVSIVNRLSKKLTDAKIVYIDVYTPLMDIIQHPTKYGFKVANKGCCGTGVIEVSVLCNPLDSAHSCTQASDYVFWDSYHPTDKTYKILTQEVLDSVENKFF
ncbi:hypothetical protein ACFE04_015022 [Oxalis oulophora]